MWTQIVGKVRLALTPWINHSWHVTLYLTSRGLTTSPIPHGFDTFEIRFDFISHELRILKSDGAVRVLPLRPQSVAEFYREVMTALEKLDLQVKIGLMPNEIANPIAFDEDETHRSLRARTGASILAGAATVRSRPEKISLPFLRKVQSGAFLLGKL